MVCERHFVLTFNRTITLQQDKSVHISCINVLWRKINNRAWRTKDAGKGQATPLWFYTCFVGACQQQYMWLLRTHCGELYMPFLCSRNRWEPEIESSESQWTRIAYKWCLKSLQSNYLFSNQLYIRLECLLHPINSFRLYHNVAWSFANFECKMALVFRYPQSWR